MESAPAPLPSRLRDVWTAELPLASGVVRVLLRGLTTCFGPLTSVEGAERLRGLPEPAIFALNHTSTFECLAAGEVSPRARPPGRGAGDVRDRPAVGEGVRGRNPSWKSRRVRSTSSHR